MRLNKNEPIYAYLKENNPEILEDDYFSPETTSIVKVPQKAPDNSITRAESSLSLLDRVKKITESWVLPGYRKGYNNNNVSCTVSIRPNEWDDVAEWMWDNRKLYSGISVLPYDDHSYVQAPFESCTKEEYEEALKSLKTIDLSKIKEYNDNTKQQQEIACSGSNGCEVI